MGTAVKRIVMLLACAVTMAIVIPGLAFADDQEILVQANTNSGVQDQSAVSAGIERASGTEQVGDGQNDALSAQSSARTAVPTLSGGAHVQDHGDTQGTTSNGVLTLGTTGESKRLEAINLSTSDPNVGLEYQSHIQNIGWESNWTNGISGTEGQSLRLEAVRIRLTGSSADLYDVFYRTHVQNIGWMNWAKNGAEAGSADYALRMEALQIALVLKGAAAPDASPAKTTDESYHRSLVATKTHVQNIGWQSAALEGEVSGSTGRGLRLEGMVIQLQNQPYSGGIRYNTHIQNIGWQGWVENGAQSGTTGQALRLEAIQIELLGEMANHYDIYYRVHAQNLGWLDWAKNGGSAGTASSALRLEALQLDLVEKGGAAPGSEAVPFVSPESIQITCSAWSQDSENARTVQIGGIAGTTGQSNPVTAIALERTGGLAATISYTTHLANVGWANAVSNGAISGERDASKNVQALTIRLEGSAANYLDIYYRAHVSTIGWLGWAKDGQEAGTSGLSLPIEAYQVQLVAKGGAAPGDTSRHYIDGASAASIRASLNISEKYHSELWHGSKPAAYQK